jgi:hypothetical protein
MRADSRAWSPGSHAPATQPGGTKHNVGDHTWASSPVALRLPAGDVAAACASWSSDELPAAAPCSGGAPALLKRPLQPPPSPHYFASVLSCCCSSSDRQPFHSSNCNAFLRAYLFLLRPRPDDLPVPLRRALLPPPPCGVAAAPLPLQSAEAMLPSAGGSPWSVAVPGSCSCCARESGAGGEATGAAVQC